MGYFFRERLFVSLAWIPKATVQAAVGPLALDMANQAIRYFFYEETDTRQLKSFFGGRVGAQFLSAPLSICELQTHTKSLYNITIFI